jgi:hypothetical protein
MRPGPKVIAVATKPAAETCASLVMLIAPRLLHGQRSSGPRDPAKTEYRRISVPSEKKRRHKAGVQLLRQVSYRQETYRAVQPL